jgi:hypothetical protein
VCGCRSARFSACACKTVFLVAMYGPIGSLSWQVGGLVQDDPGGSRRRVGSGLAFWEDPDGAVRYVEPFPPVPVT